MKLRTASAVPEPGTRGCSDGGRRVVGGGRSTRFAGIVRELTRHSAPTQEAQRPRNGTGGSAMNSNLPRDGPTPRRETGTPDLSEARQPIRAAQGVVLRSPAARGGADNNGERERPVARALWHGCWLRGHRRSKVFGQLPIAAQRVGLFLWVRACPSLGPPEDGEGSMVVSSGPVGWLGPAF